MKNESLRKVINVDKSNYHTIWIFKQEDDAVLKLSLIKGSTSLDITGQSIKLGVLRADKTLVELEDQSCFKINKNELDITLKNNILSVPGKAECDLTLIDASGKMTTTSFFIEVKKKTTGMANIIGTNIIEGLEKLKNDFKSTGDKLISAFSKEYESLKRIIIDENQAANLQDQVNQTNAQLDNIASVCVSKFGARNDGVKDNSKAFQNAVNYARDNNITRVTVPEGRYNFINSTVIVPNGINIEGIGNVELINSLENFVGVNVERHRCIFLFMAEYEEDTYSGTSGEYLMKVPTAINEVSNENLNTNILTVPTSFTTVDGRVKQQSIPNLKVGDEIRVVSYNNWIGRSLQGEFHKIKAINGSSITLEKPLKYQTDISHNSPWRKLYQTEPDSLGFYTDNGIRPNVLNYPYQGFYKIKPCTNTIKNLKFKQGTVSGRWSCLFLGAKESVVDKCEFDIPLWFMDCQDIKLKNSILKNTKHWLGNGGSGLKVENCYFDNGIIVLEEGCNDFKIINNTFRKDAIITSDSPILIYSKARTSEIVNNNLLSTGNRGIEIVNSVGKHVLKNNIINSTNSCIFLQNSTSDIEINCEITDNIFKWTRNQCFTVKSNGLGDINGFITDNTLLGNISAIYLKEGSKDINLIIENRDKNGNVLRTSKTVKPPTEGSYFNGDIVIIDNTYFRCTNSGNFNRIVNGITLTITNLSPIATVNDTSNLKVGDIINANGLPGRYKIVNIYDNKIELYPTPRTNVTSASMFLSGVPSFETL